MSDSIDVYWASHTYDVHSDRLSILVEQPDCLYNSIVKDFMDRGMNPKDMSTNYIACPAVANETKKIYVVRSPVDYTLTWDGESFKADEYDQGFFNSVFVPRDVKNGFASLRFKLLFHAENNLLVKQYPAFLFKGDFAQSTSITPGSFDISAWFRPIEPTFYFLQKNKPVQIKRGEPLYYLVFETDKKINFKRFNVTPEIYGIVERCMGVKRFMSNRKLNFLYDLFCKSGYNRKLLKEIKGNLM